MRQEREASRFETALPARARLCFGAARLRRWMALLGVALFVPSWMGCSNRGQPLGLSAQQGSTVLIGIQQSLVGIGFGGEHYTDHQRGELVFRLDGPTGPALITRFTTAAEPHPASALASSGVPLGGFAQASGSVISVVDIPLTAEPGRHTLFAMVRRDGEETPLQPSDPWRSAIWILPHEVDDDAAGNPIGETIVGRPNYPDQPPWIDFNDGLRAWIPRPQVQIGFGRRLDGPPVGAVDLLVQYPDDVISFVDLISEVGPETAPNRRPTVWMNPESSPGLVRVSAVVHPQSSSESAFTSFNLGLVFVLLDPVSEALDASEVAVVSEVVYDFDGNRLDPSQYFLSAPSIQ